MGRIRNAAMAAAEKCRKEYIPGGGEFVWTECPVCKLLVPDVHNHALNKTDEGHVILAVHES
jgi:hypothetical protein